MKINALTIRNKKTNELIYAEGNQGHGEYCSDFSLDVKWFTHEEKSSLNEAWIFRSNQYYYSEEVRHLISNYEFENIIFAIEEFEIN